MLFRSDSSKVKGTRNFIMPNEYNSFLKGIEQAIKEEQFFAEMNTHGPFQQLLKYLPDSEKGGFFPPNKIWHRDFCRVLFGLEGFIGEEMRAADLSVYDGVPFSKVSGRLKIESARERKKNAFNPYITVSNYWREKIRDDTRLTRKNHWNQVRFIFNLEDLEYYNLQK